MYWIHLSMDKPVRDRARKNPKWVDEKTVDTELAKLIHTYLNVKESIFDGMSCLQMVIRLLKNWLQKKTAGEGSGKPHAKAFVCVYLDATG